MSEAISEVQFHERFFHVLGLGYQRAVEVFRNYEGAYSADVVSVLESAVKHGMVDFVLETMERHWNITSKLQPSLMHNTVKGIFDNPVRTLFYQIHIALLNLQLVQ